MRIGMLPGLLSLVVRRCCYSRCRHSDNSMSGFFALYLGDPLHFCLRTSGFPGAVCQDHCYRQHETSIDRVQCREHNYPEATRKFNEQDLPDIERS